MTEEQDVTEAPQGEPPITRVDLVRFLDAHHADRDCPCCGNNRWDLMAKEAIEGVAMSRLGGDGLVYPNMILPALVLVCENCSYLWMVARKQVARWLKDNPDSAT